MRPLNEKGVMPIVAANQTLTEKVNAGSQIILLTGSQKALNLDSGTIRLARLSCGYLVSLALARPLLQTESSRR